MDEGSHSRSFKPEREQQMFLTEKNGSHKNGYSLPQCKVQNCRERHPIWHCAKYRLMTTSERKNYVTSNRHDKSRHDKSLCRGPSTSLQDMSKGASYNSSWQFLSAGSSSRSDNRCSANQPNWNYHSSCNGKRQSSISERSNSSLEGAR